MGFNGERGDQLSVQNIPFQDMGEVGTLDTPAWWSNPFFMSLIKNLVIGLGFLALILFVIRPLLGSLRGIRPTILENLEPLHEGGDKISTTDRAQIAMQMSEQKNLIDQAKKDPYQVAQILQNWIGEDK